MHIVITGSRGQLGQALQTHFSPSHRVTVWSRPQYDIADPACADALAALSPDVVINAAAWTDVDGAERAPDAAFAANSLGPKYLAEGCARCGAALVQISSNEVFAGEPNCFYREYDETNPGTIYARSKAAGERAVRQILDRLYIVRVAWLYGPGGSNFPSKIVAAADKHGALRVVADEYGNPTCTVDVAAALERLIETRRYGIYHLVNEGCVSRYEWAVKLLHLAGRGAIPVTPIPASEWPRAAMPPAHAVLVNQAASALGISLPPWPETLAAYVTNSK